MSFLVTSDAAYYPGLSHHPCQDYATSEDGVGVVADGCSTAPGTDLGARILAHAFLASFKSGLAQQPMAYLNHAHEVLTKLKLDPRCLYATLLTIEASRTDFVTIMRGDGIVMGRSRKDGHLKVIIKEYPGGAPFYPAYLLNPEWVSRWQSMAQPWAVSSTYKITPAEVTLVGRHQSTNIPFFDRQRWPYDEYDLVAIGSDGWQSFRHHHQNKPISALQLLPEVLAFKGMKGAFLKRRLSRQLRVLEERNTKASDDLSMVAFYHEDQP